MIFEASDFVFKASPEMARARRILIKPNAQYSLPYPVTSSRDMLAMIIKGIRKVSDADIILLEGTPTGEPIYPVYQMLEYDFPRVLTLDVRDCTLVEVDNPLPKPFAVPTFWVPNVILSSDYLISLTPLKIYNGLGDLSIMNTMTLLPSSKYGGEGRWGWEALCSLGLEKVMADLYFTLPFDLGIIEARQQYLVKDDPTGGEVLECNKVFVGEPYSVDVEASELMNIKTGYLSLIKTARDSFEIWNNAP